MFSTLSGLLRRPPRGQPRTAAGERIYAIGDVHGRLDLLDTLIKSIEAQEQELPRARVAVLLLGDLIDRGPQSRDVLERLVSMVAERSGTIVLRGNHEAALLDSMDMDPAAQRGWLENGGLATLESFGIDPPADHEDAIEFAERLSEGIAAPLQDFLRALPLSTQSGDYFFCHAGVRPGVPLAKQRADDLLWIRDGFMDDERYHGAVIVHGHTVVDQVEFRANRISIDTGAYRTGVLSALCLHEDRRWTLATG